MIMGMRIVKLLAAAAISLSLGLQVQAAEEAGSLHLWLDAGDLAVTNGAVNLYKAGEESDGGYRLLDNFGGGFVREEDARASHLAQWLAQMPQDGGITRLLDADGRASFSELPRGLYLVVQSQRMDGFHPFRPFLITVPMDGDMEIEIQPLIQPIVLEPVPATGQHPGPMIAAVGMVLSGLGLAWMLLPGRRVFGITK